MKLRGKKRYYRNLAKEQIPALINFVDNEKNWFDFYHHHIFNKDKKNKSWTSRKQHLDALFCLAEKYENCLKNMSREFQYWININELDSDKMQFISTQKIPINQNFQLELKIIKI